MSDDRYRLKTVDSAFEVLRVLQDAGRPLSLSEIAEEADKGTSNAFRLLKSLEASGLVQRDSDKRYSASPGSGGPIGVSGTIDILDALASAPKGWLATDEIAESLGCDMAETTRALEKLAARGVVGARPELDGWTLAQGMMRFLRPLLNDEFFARAVRPSMEEMSHRFQETVSWFVADGWEQIVVNVIPSPRTIRYVLETGGRQPTYLGAAGKAYLAALPIDTVATFLNELDPVSLTRFTLDKTALMTELDQIRTVGFAQSIGERVEGAASVAVCVSDTAGKPVGVLSIMMPQFRVLPELMDEMGRALCEQVAQITPDARFEAAL